jgi:hypothetical protein
MIAVVRDRLAVDVSFPSHQNIHPIHIGSSSIRKRIPKNHLCENVDAGIPDQKSVGIFSRQRGRKYSDDEKKEGEAFTHDNTLSWIFD